MTTETQAGKHVQWGVLGAARILRRTLPGLKAAHNADLVAIASRDQAKGREAALQWGAKQSFASYEALLADPQIEAVYIPLPNALHIEWVIKAVEAGKHVLCEKPLALTVEDVRRVEEAARRNNRLVMEAFMYRFHPQQAQVREWLAAGQIGQARLLRGTYAFPLATNAFNIRLDKSLGGGATWDVGCYGVNVSRWMFGAEPLRVMATGTIDHGVDMDVVAVLDFTDGRRAVLDYGLTYGRRSFYEIIGQAGSLSVENMWQEPDIAASVYLRNDKGLTTTEIAPANHFQLEVEAFSQVILANQPSPYPLTDTAANVRVCQAILQALTSGQAVELTALS